MVEALPPASTTIRPKINTAKFMGSSHAAGNALSKQVQINTINISSIKSVLDSETLKVSNLELKVGSHERALEETNSILTDIGNALALDFANRIAEAKDDISNIKEQKSRGKFGRAENRLESKGKRAGNIFTQTASKAASPVQGFFGKILSFIGLLGTGIGLNFGAKWLEDPKNRKKLVKVGEFLKNNWKLVAGVIVGGGLLIGLSGILGTLFSVFAIISNPIFLGALAIAAIAGGGALIANKVGGKDNKMSNEPLDRVNQFDYSQSFKDKDNFQQNAKKSARQNLEAAGGSGIGIPGLRNGGIIDGPKSGYPAILHGKEMFIPLDKLSQNPRRRQPKITTINLPTITKGSVPKGESNVATAVPNIPSANPADPYRQLTPNMYGIYV